MDIAVEEGMWSWLTLVFVSTVVMEICIVEIDKFAVALMLNEKLELGVATKQKVEKKQIWKQ